MIKIIKDENSIPRLQTGKIITLDEYQRILWFTTNPSKATGMTANFCAELKAGEVVSHHD